MLLAMTACAGGWPAQPASPSVARLHVGDNVPVTAVDLRREPANNSPALAEDPTEPRFVVAANRVDNPFSCALDISGDSGLSWVPVNPILRLPQGAKSCYAPEVAFDARGTLYYLFIGLQGLGNSPMGVFITTSSDRGRTFAVPREVLGPEHYMVRMAIDRSIGDGGRIHLVWLEARTTPPTGGLGPPPNPIMSAYSDDGARHFSRPVQVSDPTRRYVVAPVLTLGPSHAVHVLYYDLGRDVRDYQGLEGPTWDGTWSLVLASSHDGDRFGPGIVVDSRIRPLERVMLIYTMPPASLGADGGGRLYVAWPDARSGQADVLLRASGDGGLTWTEPRRLNDDPAADGRTHYMPKLSVAPDGRVDAVFYDRRRDPQNVRNDVYYTFSTDGGASFAHNLRLTSESSDSRRGTQYPIPSAEGMHEFGSRIALLSEDNRALAAWTDTRNTTVGVQQDVFAAEVDLDGGRGGSSQRWYGLAGIPMLALLPLTIVALRRVRGRVRA